MELKKYKSINEYNIIYSDTDNRFYISIDFYGKENGFIRMNLDRRNDICEINKIISEETGSLYELLSNKFEKTKQMILVALNYIIDTYHWINKFTFTTPIQNLEYKSEPYILNYYYILFYGKTWLEYHLDAKALEHESDYLKHIVRMNNVNFKKNIDWDYFDTNIFRGETIQYKNEIKKIYETASTFAEFSKLLLEYVNDDILLNSKWLSRNESEYFHLFFDNYYHIQMLSNKYLNKERVLNIDLDIKSIDLFNKNNVGYNIL